MTTGSVTRIRPETRWASMVPDLREAWRYRDLLLALAARDIKLRYRQTLLGAAWVIFQPLAAAGIFAVVFGLIAHLPAGGRPYFVFAYAGQLAWMAFAGAFARAASSVVAAAPVVSKVYFPRLILPAGALISSLLDLVVAAALMVVLMIAYRIAPGAPILLLPVWLALLLMLASGCGLMAAALMVRYRDVQYLLPLLLPLLMYASPVAYSLADALPRLPPALRPVISANPLAGLIEGFRWSLLGGSQPPIGAVGLSVVFTIIALLAGLCVFKRMERRFADVI